MLAGTSAAPKGTTIDKNALTVLVQLRGVSGKPAPFFEGVPAPATEGAWNCKPDNQPSVMCHPKTNIEPEKFAPPLQLTVKVPDEYGQNQLTIDGEVMSLGNHLPLPLEKISVVTRHSIQVTSRSVPALTTAATTSYVIDLVNKGPSEATKLVVSVAVTGPAEIQAVDPVPPGGWKKCERSQNSLTCERDRLGVRDEERATLTVPIKATSVGEVTIKTEVNAASGHGASATTNAKVTAP